MDIRPTWILIDARQKSKRQWAKGPYTGHPLNAKYQAVGKQWNKGKGDYCSLQYAVIIGVLVVTLVFSMRAVAQILQFTITVAVK